MLSENIKVYSEMVESCDALLIGAGAGMGTDSGLPDFRGKEGFWRAYPPLAKLGIRFEEMANPSWFKKDPKLAWGFYGHRYNLYQKTKPHQGYFIIRKWVNHFRIPSFVFTSNVDGHFNKAGWVDQVLECHGSLMNLQCTHSCGQPIWALSDHLTEDFDICLDTLICKSPLPVCPNCGGLARPNILMFSDFYWDRSNQLAQENNFQSWQIQNCNNKLLIMELGAGLNVPTVRFFCEKIWRDFSSSMIRVNPHESTAPNGVHSIAKGALETVKLIDANLVT